MTAVLVSRFLLHLQAANRTAIDHDASISSEAHDSSLVFNRVIGSLASSLVFADNGIENNTSSDMNSDSMETDYCVSKLSKTAFDEEVGAICENTVVSVTQGERS